MTDDLEHDVDLRCVFCRIVSGEEPADIVYEDDTFIAILYLQPWVPGHLVLLPREHFSSIVAFPEPMAGRFLTLASRLGTAAERAVDADGFALLTANEHCAGQVVRHAHFHILPRFSADGLVLTPRPSTKSVTINKTAMIAEIRQRMGSSHEKG